MTDKQLTVKNQLPTAKSDGYFANVYADNISVNDTLATTKVIQASNTVTGFETKVSGDGVDSNKMNLYANASAGAPTIIMDGNIGLVISGVNFSIVDGQGLSLLSLSLAGAIACQNLNVVKSAIVPARPANDNSTNAANTAYVDSALSTVSVAFTGDTKYSYQSANHVSGKGAWLLANGQAIPAQYTKARTLFGTNLPNLTDRTLAMAGGSYKFGDLAGVYSQTLTPEQLASHAHTDDHVHNDDHTHGDDHNHGDIGHNHGINSYTGGTSASTVPRGSASQTMWFVGNTEWSNAQINYKSQAGFGTVTGSKNAAGYGATTSWKSQSGSGQSAITGYTGSNQPVSILQPTAFLNLFIYCD